MEREAFSLRSRRLLRSGLVLSQMPYLEGGTFLRRVRNCTVTWVSNPMTRHTRLVRRLIRRYLRSEPVRSRTTRLRA